MMLKYRLEELILENGESPFGDWFRSLDPVPAAKVRVALIRLQQGNLSRVEWFSGIGEYKIDWGPGIRVYLARDGLDLLLLLGGGSKKRQHDDICDALSHWRDYKSRKQTEIGE